MEVAEERLDVQIARRRLAKRRANQQAHALLVARRKVLRDGRVSSDGLEGVLARGGARVGAAEVEEAAVAHRPPRLRHVRLARAEAVGVDEVVHGVRTAESRFHVDIDGVVGRHVAAAGDRLQILAERVVAAHQLVGVDRTRRVALERVPQAAHARARHRVEHAQRWCVRRPRCGEDGEREYTQVTHDARGGSKEEAAGGEGGGALREHYC